MTTYKSSVLNLWTPDESTRFRIAPTLSGATIEFNAGMSPVEIVNLEVAGVNVYSKMNENAQAVADEEARAMGAEDNLLNDLTAETSRAVSAENAFNNAFNDEKARVATQEAFEAGERALEQSQRISADNAFTANLNAEIQSRQANDTQHTNDINTELLRAQGEESRIEQRFDVYVYDNDVKVNAGDAKHDAYEVYANDRMLALESKSTTDGSSNSLNLQNEIDARVSEVARLDGRVDFIVSNVDPVALDSLTEIVNKFNADGSTYESRLSNLEQVIQQLVEQLSN